MKSVWLDFKKSWQAANEGIMTQRLNEKKAATSIDRMAANLKKKNIISAGWVIEKLVYRAKKVARFIIRGEGLFHLLCKHAIMFDKTKAEP